MEGVTACKQSWTPTALSTRETGIALQEECAKTDDLHLQQALSSAKRNGITFAWSNLGKWLLVFINATLQRFTYNNFVKKHFSCYSFQICLAKKEKNRWWCLQMEMRGFARIRPPARVGRNSADHAPPWKSYSRTKQTYRAYSISISSAYSLRTNNNIFSNPNTFIKQSSSS